MVALVYGAITLFVLRQLGTPVSGAVTILPSVPGVIVAALLLWLLDLGEERK
jgi:hypothetical protein